MIFRVYSLLMWLLLPVLMLRLWVRSWKAPAYGQRLSERLGIGKTFQPNGIWVHAVSVGETIAIEPLVRQLMQTYPDLPITFTTMTPTGSEQVKARFGDSVQHCYLPYDVKRFMEKTVARINPKLTIIVETEIWPNLIRTLRENNYPVLMANARLSARSARGYQRFSALSTPILGQITHIAVQSQAEAERFTRLGVKPQALTVTGSIKFDVSLSKQTLDDVAQLKLKVASERFVWIAASTHEGEEEVILEAHKKLLQVLPDALLVLVPRHPERFKSVAKKIDGFDLTRVNKSALGEAAMVDQQVLLGDTMGELLSMYGIADVAFIGGSLIDRGGHNPLEPALFGLPLMMGNSSFNFKAIVEKFVDAGALREVENSQAMFEDLRVLSESAQQAQARGNAASQVLADNKGALKKHLDIIDSMLN